MICTIDGKQYDIPASEIMECHPSGIVATRNGFVSEDDIARADEVALYRGKHDYIEIQRMRLNIELYTGEKFQTPPIGIEAKGFWCHWEIRQIERSVLKNYSVLRD
jgi:hypothetical protein